MKKIAILLILISLNGCGKSVTKPNLIPPTVGLTALKTCTPIDQEPFWKCSDESISIVGHALIDCNYDDNQSAIRTKHERNICLARQSQLQDEIEYEKIMHWVYGFGGFCLGVGIIAVAQ